MDDMDIYEVNEASASVPLVWAKVCWFHSTGLVYVCSVGYFIGQKITQMCSQGPSSDFVSILDVSLIKLREICAVLYRT